VRGLDPGLLPTGPQSVTAQFEHGGVSGFSGCNRFFGSYSWQQGRLVIGQTGGSMMACEPAAMKIEGAVTRAIAGSFRPLLAGDRLTLQSEAGEPVMRFQAEPEATLEGLNSTITGFNNGRQAVVSPAVGSTITLAFAHGLVKGFAGCNTFRASYQAEGERIAVGPVATTRRVCADKALMQQEHEFLAALRSSTRWAFSGALLDMHRPHGERTLTGTRE
jgi:heat shock protein HslJ